MNDLSHIAEPLRALAVPVASLNPDPANARTHDRRNLDAIKASLAKFGQRLPLVVQKAGDRAAQAIPRRHLSAPERRQPVVERSEQRELRQGFLPRTGRGRAGRTTHEGVDRAMNEVEVVEIKKLKPHPRNYRAHPEDELKHLVQSIKDYGIYRNIVIANDDVILAGHGVVQAAMSMGMTEVPVVRLQVASTDPRALKVLVADNEIAHLGERDDRYLSELLKEIKDTDATGLFGTGYDEMMLANLVFVTRPESEIPDFNAAREWAGAGTPEYDLGTDPLKIIVSFKTPEDRAEFARLLGLKLSEKTKATWFPPKAKDDVKSVKFEG